MPPRVSASEITSQRIRALLRDVDEGDLRLSSVELSTRRLIEKASGAEVRDALGRKRHERRREEGESATAPATGPAACGESHAACNRPKLPHGGVAVACGSEKVSG
jgi:hypothetical protein